MTTFSTLLDFDGVDGASPVGKLAIDSAGDLFGVTSEGGSNGDGVVFELAKTANGYATAPTVLVNLDAATGGNATAGLTVDAAGNLFGTTSSGGAAGAGAAFEIAKTSAGYANAPTILASFGAAGEGPPSGGLMVDAAGDLFGATTTGAARDAGAVFEIAKTGAGYAAPTIVASFSSPFDTLGVSGLTTDSAGNIFGTLNQVIVGGGISVDVSVFEIAKTSAGYENAPRILAATAGAALAGSNLLADASGNLFGEISGGIFDDGLVFELARTPSGYANSLMTIASFGSGTGPSGGLVADAVGDLFGTTEFGSLNSSGSGNLFEVSRLGGAYSTTPTTQVQFNGVNGLHPEGLIADGSGHFFGLTASGGTDNSGTVFEFTPDVAQVFAITSVTFGADLGSVSVEGSYDSAEAGSQVALLYDSLVAGTANPGIFNEWNGTINISALPGAHALAGQASNGGGVTENTGALIYSGRPAASPFHSTVTVITGGGVRVGAGDGAVKLFDLSSHDTLVGGAGTEALYSISGANDLVAGTGLNTLWGGSGDDTLGGGSAVRALLIAGPGAQSLVGGSLAGSSDTLRGGSGSDWLASQAGNDRLIGGRGDDTLQGGTGDDTIWAGVGHDTIYAGKGDDTINLTFGGQTAVNTGLGQKVIVGATGDDTITGIEGIGSRVHVFTSESSSQLASRTVDSSGYTKLSFAGGQVLTVRSVTIDFHDGSVMHT